MISSKTIGGAITGNCEGTYEIFKNPIYSAIVIALITLLIIIFTFHNSNDPLWKKSTKTFIYVFLASGFILFLHNHFRKISRKIGRAAST